MVTIVKAFLSVGLLAGLFGVLLAFASKKLAVKKDKRVEDLEEILPGSNCGACGYAGCASYAKAMAEDETGELDITLCSPGGAQALEQLGSYLEREVDSSIEKQVAFVMCRGNRTNASFDYEYHGLEDCNAVHMHFNGDKTCKFGCLGRESCIKVCPVDAIFKDKNGNILIDKNLCISCEKCVIICPTNVIKMIPESADVTVVCNSTDKGAVVRKYCKVGCIGCKLCEKSSPDSGFITENFLARIDYNVKGDRNAAVVKCPPKCIVSTDVISVPDAVITESTDNEKN